MTLSIRVCCISRAPRGSQLAYYLACNNQLFATFDAAQHYEIPGKIPYLGAFPGSEKIQRFEPVNPFAPKLYIQYSTCTYVDAMEKIQYMCLVHST